MIETLRLIIADRQLKDIPMEEFYARIYPEVNELDPPVGECRNPQLYSIFRKEDGRHVGLCCLYNFTGTEIELGVRIFDPGEWSKGYGTEVVNALCESAFQNSPLLGAVLAKTPVHNTRARKCYKKCGFIEHSYGILEDHEMVFMIKKKGG